MSAPTIPLPRREPAAESSDWALVRRAQEGDGFAFLTLYDRHLPDLWTYARGRCCDETDCKQLITNIFVLAIDLIGELRESDSFPAWLKRLGDGLVTREDRHLLALEAFYEAARDD